MLTRIEIDGFKTFEKFSLDLNPFCVIVGPNATGKSNLFDALRLLARLADTDVRAALHGLRGEPSEMFRVMPDGVPAKQFTIAVEALLDREVMDPYGKSHPLKGMRIRYEVGIERRIAEKQSLEKLYIFREDARLIPRATDRLFTKRSQKAKSARSKWAPPTQKRQDLIKTSEIRKEIEISQDGVQGRPRTIPFGEASATFLSTVRTADEFLHLFALREELVALRFLQLDPAAERMPSDVLARDELMPDGSNLATVLHRIKTETSNSERPGGDLAEIRSDLAALIPGVLELDVERNESARQFQIFVTMRDNARFSSRVLSDGTLRILALLTLLHDPKRRGVLCFEEPENGLHEARIEGLISLLRGFCTDLDQEPQEKDRLSQIIVNTHSPEVMRHLKDEEIVAADMVLVADPIANHRYRRSRMRTGVTSEFPISSPDEREHRLTRIELDQLLRNRKAEVVS